MKATLFLSHAAIATLLFGASCAQGFTALPGHTKKPVAISPQDKEIASLKAQVKQLQADLVIAQAKIDDLETGTVQPQANQPSATSGSTNQVTVSDFVATSFPNGDSAGDPLWVITFQIDNASAQDIADPLVFVNCTDNNVGDAFKYSGPKGMTVVNPNIIHPSQVIHLKYGWIAVTPTEVPAKATVDIGSSTTVQQLSVVGG